METYSALLPPWLRYLRNDVYLRLTRPNTSKAASTSQDANRRVNGKVCHAGTNVPLVGEFHRAGGIYEPMNSAIGAPRHRFKAERLRQRNDEQTPGADQRAGSGHVANCAVCQYEQPSLSSSRPSSS